MTNKHQPIPWSELFHSTRRTDEERENNTQYQGGKANNGPAQTEVKNESDEAFQYIPTNRTEH